MLAEYLDGRPDAVWAEIMPGARACRFMLGEPEGPYPRELRPELKPLHFEALFCLRGALTLTRRDGTELRAGKREILLLSNAGGIASARLDGPMAGVLVAVDARGAKRSLRALCSLLGELELDTAQVRRRMAALDGCALLSGAAWSRAAFEHLDVLPPGEQGRYCVFKSVELLYLLCARQGGAREEGGADAAMTHTLEMVRAYMTEHMDRKLTIPELSRRFYIAPTSLKAGFRRLYGQPIHAWLRERRMERAAALLRGTDLSVLEISQAVGFASASQFGANFLKYYGTSPAKYRKMSVSGEIPPENGGQGGGETV